MSKKAKTEQFVVQGSILYAESDEPAAGLTVVAMDADFKVDDTLGEAVTDKEGNYRIVYDASKFKDRREEAPDVYLKILDEDQQVLVTSREYVKHNVGHLVELNLQVPGGIGIPRTRSHFPNLILQNPNYFGNMPQLDFEPVEIMSANTTYEALTCLGLHPDQEFLEAVVHIKRHSGYGSGPCGDGSVEYVRFFIEKGGSWHDIGVSSFNVYNMSGSPLPLNYTATIPLSEVKKYCGIENLKKVRAILSWNQEPPAGDPNWTPPWGNRIDATVQIDTWNLVLQPVEDLVAAGLLEVNKTLLKQLKLDQPLPLAEPQALSYAELKEMYVEQDVPASRFGFTQALQLAEKPISSHLIKQVEIGNQFDLIPGLDLGNILDDLVQIKGNTSYEQLTCAGYNPQTREVGGVIRIKKSAGYSGGLCTPGSTEYVGFWVEYGGSWHALGTAEVQVHDLAGVGGGTTVEYAVARLTNNVPELPCEDLIGLRLRAILSWNQPPTGPHFPPIWGNVLDTYIQPPIGETLDPDELNRLRLMRFNRMPIDAISNVTGRATNPTPVAGDCGGIDRPFAGNVYIEGDFVHKIDVFNHLTGDLLPGTHPLLYQVFWHKVGSLAAPTQLTSSFSIKVFPEDALSPVTKTQSVTSIGGSEYYTYMESNTQAVNPRMLAVWPVSGLDDGLYTLEVRGFAYDGSASAYVQTNSVVQKIYIYNGYLHQESVLQPDGTVGLVDRKRPQLTFTMDGGVCSDVTVGTKIKGTYSVRDYFFGSLKVRMVPLSIGGVTHVKTVTITNPGSVVPHPGVNPTLQTVSGDWELDTKGLPACGYTVELLGWDRALVNNGCTGHYNRIGLGFCLRPPVED